MLSTFFIAAFVVISAYIDYEHLRDRDYIESHVSRWLLRLLFIVSASRSYFDFVGMSLFFMATFDQVLNVMRGKDLFYLGNTAYWDRFFNRFPYAYIIFKVVTFFSSLFILWI